MSIRRVSGDRFGMTMNEQQPVSDNPFEDGDLYDALFHQVDYAQEFYLGLARSANGPILEIGCGTGRITLPCLRAGAVVDGLDLSAPMLDRLRQKCHAEGFQPALHQGDMNRFDLPGRYAMVMITFNAFIHNLTQADQISCLESCRRHLRPGGMLVFDVFFPGLSIIAGTDGVRVLELETTHPQTGQMIRLFDTRRFDRVEQLQFSLNEVEVLDDAGSLVRTQRSRFAVRWTYKSEMELLLKAAGFRKYEISGDFDLRPLTKETDAMIVRAWAE